MTHFRYKIVHQLGLLVDTEADKDSMNVMEQLLGLGHKNGNAGPDVLDNFVLLISRHMSRISNKNITELQHLGAT